MNTTLEPTTNGYYIHAGGNHVELTIEEAKQLMYELNNEFGNL